MKYPLRDDLDIVAVVHYRDHLPKGILSYAIEGWDGDARSEMETFMESALENRVLDPNEELKIVEIGIQRSIVKNEGGVDQTILGLLSFFSPSEP